MRRVGLVALILIGVLVATLTPRQEIGAAISIVGLILASFAGLHDSWETMREMKRRRRARGDEGNEAH